MAQALSQGTVLPDYRGGGIVNLMSTIAHAFGAEESRYPPLAALPPAALASRNVVLLVIDGLGHDFLLAKHPSGSLARHLEARITSVFPTTTATAVTTFLTGTAPQQHGVTGWFVYFRELDAVLAVLPYRQRLGGSPPPTAAAQLLELSPLSERLDAASHVVAPQSIVHSAFNAALQGSAQLHAFTTLDELLAKAGAIVREPRRRNYVYAYWPELDRLAHEHGIGSRESAGHLAELDSAIDLFAASIRGTGTTLIVTADHGFIDAGARVELDAHPTLERQLRLPLCGEPRVAYCYPHAELRDDFRDYVRAHLEPYANLVESERLIEAEYFGFGAPHERLRERIGDYALLMRQNAVIKDWLPGEKRYAHVGVHGGLTPAEMYVPLIVMPA